MAPGIRQLQQEFSSSLPSFWRWAEDGQSILRGDTGETIVFRADLANLLEELAPFATPPLNSVLAVLAVCRDGPTGETAAFSIPSQWINRPDDLADQAIWQQEVESPCQEALKRLHQLPSEWRTQRAGRRLLLQVIFEGYPLRGSTTSPAAIEWLRADAERPVTTPDDQAQEPSASQQYWEINCLLNAVQRVSPEVLAHRRATGLDDLPVARLPKLLDATAVAVFAPRQDWLRELEQDPEHAALARLALRLRATVSLPCPPALPLAQEPGGVSDLSNRGPIDRLLISELAQDPDMLSLRVALNEALYLQREPPPHRPPLQRCVLVDTGLRLWGLPRLYATAVALSLVSDADATPARLFRPNRQELSPSDLLTKDGLREHLACLDDHSHPGYVLEDWARQMDGTSQEAVLITSEDVLADREFRQELARVVTGACFLVGVSRDGRLSLSYRTFRGETLLRQIQVDLDDLSTPTARPKARLLNRQPATPRPDQWPAILRREPFPLLLPHAVDFSQAVPILDDEAFPEGAPSNPILAMTSDRRLMLWTEPGIAARQLCDSLPNGKFLNYLGHRLAVVGSPSTGRLWAVHLDFTVGNCGLIRLDLPEESIQGVSLFQGFLIVVSKQDVRVVSPETGNLLAEWCVQPGFAWLHGRFFRQQERCLAVAFDGQAVTCRTLVEKSLPGRNVFLPTAAWDCRAIGAPLILYSDGSLWNTATLKPLEWCDRKTLGGSTLLWLGAHGNRAIIRREKNSPAAILDIPSQSVTTAASPATAHIKTEMTKVALWNLRTKFQAVQIGDNNSLQLLTKNQQILELRLSGKSHGSQLRWHVLSSPQNSQKWSPFESFQEPPGVGYRLKKAILNSGAEVVLDSRGLLHLLSPDRMQPEITFVLSDDAAAWWSTSGSCWGPSYFLPQETDGRFEQVDLAWQEILQPFLQSLS